MADAKVNFDTMVIPAAEMASVLDSKPIDPTPAIAQPDPIVKTEDTPPAQKVEAPATPVDETPAEPEPVKIKVKDAEYTEDEIATAIEDSKNKANWNKTNADEARRIAGIRKAIDPVLKFVQKLKDDGEFGQEIRDAAIDRYGDEFSGVIDAALSFDESAVPNPFKDELKSATDAREAAEYELFVMKEKRELARAEKLSEKKVDDVWAFAEKIHQESGEVLSLASAYKLMQHDDLKKKAESPPIPKPPAVPNPAPGAQDIKSHPAKSFDDISSEGYKLFG